jgi:hypothetical protein
MATETSMPIPGEDELAMRVAKLAGRTQAILELARYPDPDLIEENRRVYDALLGVLRMHSLTAYHRHVEYCAAHRGTLTGHPDCPDCREVEWYGCDRCRDENGDPARPEDCRERQTITSVLRGEGAGDGG